MISINPKDKIPVFASHSEDYGAEFFPLFLSRTNQKKRASAVFEKLLPRPDIAKQTRPQLAVDGGAGGGAMLPDLCRRYQKVRAIEPNHTLGAMIKKDFPEVELMLKTIMDTNIEKECADLLLLSHILYYIEKNEWEGNLRHGLEWVKPGAQAIVVLQNRNSSYQRMIGQLFGTDLSYDMQPVVWGLADKEPSLDVQFVSDDAYVESSDPLEMTKIAVFMANLVPPEHLSKAKLPTWGELQEWVTKNYPPGANGKMRMSCRQDVAVISKH